MLDRLNPIGHAEKNIFTAADLQKEGQQFFCEATFGSGLVSGLAYTGNPEQDRAIFYALAWLSACPVPERVYKAYATKERGLEWIQERYLTTLQITQNLIWPAAQMLNPTVSEQLHTAQHRENDEQVGIYDPVHVPESHLTTIHSMNLPANYAASRVLIILGQTNTWQDLVANDQIISVLGISLKDAESANDFLALLTINVLDQLPDLNEEQINAVLDHTLSPEKFQEERNAKTYQQLRQLLLARAQKIEDETKRQLVLETVDKFQYDHSVVEEV